MNSTWIPLGPRPVALAAGHHWDAVRVPRTTGLRVLTALGDTSGPVIEDPRTARLYWLVPAGTAETWDVSLALALGRTSYVTVPPLGQNRGPGIHWLVPPAGRLQRTDPEVLRAALVAAR